ncbi:MAG: hypothetical protein JNJ41_18395 [Bacteroidia bacterium]|nr:hypothetical protein [Bacteroidia bacterium]
MDPINRRSFLKTSGIVMLPANEKNQLDLLVNETIMYQSNTYIIDAFKKSLI